MGQPTTRRRRLGRGRLRFRITAVFALGGFVIAAVLAGTTYFLAERYLIRQRERSLESQAYVDARSVRDTLQRQGEARAALDALERTPDSNSVVRYGNRWYASSLGEGLAVIPAELRALVAAGNPAHQRVVVRGDPWLVVGVPLPAVQASYFEVFLLSELDHSLGVIRNSLVAATVLATAAAGLFGLWAGRRVLAPLSEVSAAAAEVAAGNLDTRLEDQDDPDLAQLVGSFNSMVDALQGRIERDARFAASVSHELRSPLTTLGAAASLLEARRDELPERAATAVDLLVVEVRRFEQLVEDLLELGRMDAGGHTTVLEPVHLDELMQHTVQRAGHPEIPVRVEPTVAESTILVDKRRLERVLSNLIQNAQIHGGGAVDVTAERVDGTVRIAVTDRGPGVPAGERDRVFERFFRGAASGRRNDVKGTGLGLALVTEHVRAHGGSAWVEDAPGQGARFVVELPWREG